MSERSERFLCAPLALAAPPPWDLSKTAEPAPDDAINLTGAIRWFRVLDAQAAGTDRLLSGLLARGLRHPNLDRDVDWIHQVVERRPTRKHGRNRSGSLERPGREMGLVDVLEKGVGRKRRHRPEKGLGSRAKPLGTHLSLSDVTFSRTASPSTAPERPSHSGAVDRS